MLLENTGNAYNERMSDGTASTLSTDGNESATMTPEQLAEAQRYGQRKLWASLADQALDLLILGVLALVFARSLDAWLASFISSASLRLVALFVLITAIHGVLGLPLVFYSGYVLEHQFGLSRQSAGRWLWRQAKQFSLMLLLGAVLLLGLYWLIWTTGPYWWLAAAGAFFVVSVVLGQLAPVLLLPLFYKVEPLNDPTLSQRFARLAEGTGLAIQGIYRLVLSNETAKANAMLAGLGRTRRVLLGDTLLSGFTPEEIEVVIAHEVGHHVFRHIPKLIASGFVTSIVGFWLTDRALALWVGPQAYDPHHLPVATLPALLFLVTLFGILIEPLQNMVSRRYERQCDRYALKRTGSPAVYRSAFQKLARLNKDDPAPHPLEVFLFHSHPPIAERLAMTDE
jgi:STE24 endopeptidase